MMKIKWLLFILILFTSKVSFAQTWQYHNPTFGFDVNTVDILGQGVIVLGGGQEVLDSFQVMFRTDNYGQSWTENEHDGLAPWNKSIAFSDPMNGFGAGNDGRIIKTDDGGLHWGNAVNPVNRDFNKIVNIDALTYIVAGGNDSTQTIVKTIDGGSNWSVMYDQPGHQLRSVYFIDPLNGIAVGDSGLIIASTDGGSAWTPVIPPVQRNFNDIYILNADTGYIVGGYAEGNRTILRTTDGGINWAIVMDATGGMLSAVSFADPLTGYAVGDSATVLKTTDGGLNWLPEIIDSNLSGNEQFRAVKFYDVNFGVIGGKGGVLYIYSLPLPYTTFHTEQVTSQTYTSATLNGTIDGVTVPMNLFFEYDTTLALSNSVQANPSFVNDTFSHTVFANVNSLNPNTTYYYRLMGEAGSTFYYGNILTFEASQDAYNSFKTKTATEVTDSSAVLNGSISGLYYPTPVTVSFEYGTTENLGQEINAGTASLPDTLSHLVSVALNGLSPDTALYYYRLKVEVGPDTYVGDIRRLNTGIPEIPNWDFLHWQNITTQLPSDWIVVGNDIQQVSGHSGSTAINLSRQTALINFRFVGGDNGEVQFYDGQPFHYRPDSLIFYANYNVVAGDSACVWVRLYSGNNTMADDVFYFTGNSGGNFNRLSFPISYNSSSVPDSLMLAFFPINFFSSHASNNPANYITIDDIVLLPAAPSVTNGNFENWFSYSMNELVDWNYSKYIPAGVSQGTDHPSIVQTLFAQPDDYAAEVQIYANDGKFTNITLGLGNNNMGFTQDIAVNGRHQSFNGYYQYTPQNGDSMRLYLGLFNAGQRIGSAYYTTSTPSTSGFIPFDIPINYYSLTNLIPDSAGIEISAGIGPSKGASKLKIDKLSFDGLRKASLDSTISIQSIIGKDEMKVYPNPARDLITIELNDAAAMQAGVVQLYNFSGQLLKEISVRPGENRLSFSVAEMAAGIYLLKWQGGNKVINRKIAVMK